MSYHLVNVTVDKGRANEVFELAEREGVTFSGISAPKGQTRTMTFLAAGESEQKLLDDLQSMLSDADEWQIVISPVDAVVKKSADEEDAEDVTETREALLEQVSKGANLTPTFLTLVGISAIVAALGMIENNVSGIIGAMVIAPLLGPVLASILGVSLGENDLIIKAVKAGLAGIALAIAIAALLGFVLGFDTTASELSARASVGFGDIALALASGAAAALSLTAGAASILVGVMVAVALMPPAAAIGLFLGKGAWLMAGGAGLLLAINLVALQLSGQVVFLLRGVKPRTWYRRAKVKQSRRVSLVVLVVLLFILAFLVTNPLGF